MEMSHECRQIQITNVRAPGLEVSFWFLREDLESPTVPTECFQMGNIGARGFTVAFSGLRWCVCSSCFPGNGHIDMLQCRRRCCCFCFCWRNLAGGQEDLRLHTTSHPVVCQLYHPSFAQFPSRFFLLLLLLLSGPAEW